MSNSLKNLFSLKNVIIAVLFLGIVVQFFIYSDKFSGTQAQQNASGLNNDRKKLPNIFLISLDACRADHLSCYGYHRNTSPFLDEVAKEGILFSNAFINTHSTPPSHTTILTSLYQETHKVDYYQINNRHINDHSVPDGVLMIQELLMTQGYINVGVSAGGFMSRRYGYSRGFTEYDDLGGGALSETNRVAALIKKYITTGRPIFAFLHTYEIHSPYFPPGKYKELFGDFRSDFIPSSENLLKIRNEADSLSDEDLAFLNAMYDSEIKYTDDCLKKMFTELKNLGFFENCIVIITSDHGEEFGEHGGLLHRKDLLYDELIKIPLIITGTGIPSGIVSDRMVSTIDIVPTILGYTGIISNPNYPVMGENILEPRPVQNVENEESVFSQYGDRMYSVRTKKWKFIQNQHSFELYNMEGDPGELSNVFDKHPELSKKFQKMIYKWKKVQPDIPIKPKAEVKAYKDHMEKLKSLGYVN